MKTKTVLDEKLDMSRGAPMGRRSWYEAFMNCTHHFVDSCTETCFNHVTINARLYKVPLDSGGYDRGGAYWGSGGSGLWFAEGEKFFVSVNAPDRAQAAQKVREIVAQYGGKVNFRGIPRQE
jgi:hypothetical protein